MTPRYILRPEARPIHWDRLNQSQKEALLKILEALDEACRDVETASERANLRPSLPEGTDRLRSSRLIFLSGQRGTGKSTVLISLFQAINEAAANARNSRQREEERPRPRKLEEEIPYLLGALRDRLIWLEPLDMEPLPRPTNLLAAILARVDRAISRSARVEAERPRTQGLLNLAAGEKALHNLRKLASDVAIAWDGNVEARAGSLDPDAYAEEVSRVEEARLGINKRLDDALGQLACELERTGNVKNPIFVLPVDDYDLNPLRALDLLHLLRMVSSPRLFILVLGDVRTAEIVFNLKKSGEFAAVVQAARHPEYLSLSTSDIASMAHSLSGHAIRKLVPPGQRLFLGNMTVQEALSFHPRNVAVQEKDQDKEGCTLQYLLQKLPVDIETAVETDGKQYVGGKEIANFEDFLRFDLLKGTSTNNKTQESNNQPSSSGTVPQVAEPAKDEPATDVIPYTGAVLLKATPRYIADLWFSLNEMVGQASAKLDGNLSEEQRREEERKQRLRLLSELIERVGEEAHRAVEEDSLLSIRYRERFVDALGIGPDEGWLQAMNFVEGRSVSVPARQVTFPDRGCVLQANYHRSWIFWDLGERKGIDIDERAKGLLVLLHDLLALERVGGILGSHALSPDSLHLGWAYASWDVGFAEAVKVQWITPAWTSFWEFDQFSRIWQQALHSAVWHQLSNGPTQRAFLAYVWIAASLKILGDENKQTHPQILIPESDLDALSNPNSSLWKSLEDGIKAVASAWKSSTGARANRILSFLLRLPVLLTPEAGFMISEKTSEKASEQELAILKERGGSLLQQKEIKEIWESQRNIDEVRRLRADRLAAFGVKGSAEFRDTKYIINTLDSGRFCPEDDEVLEACRRADERNSARQGIRAATALESLAHILRELQRR